MVSISARRKGRYQPRGRRRVLCVLFSLIGVLLFLFARRVFFNAVDDTETRSVGLKESILSGTPDIDAEAVSNLARHLRPYRNFAFWGNKNDLLNCTYYENKIWFTAVDSYPNLLPEPLQFVDASNVFFSESENTVPDGFLKDILELLQGNPTAAQLRQPVVMASAGLDRTSLRDLTVYIGTVALHAFFSSLETYSEGGIIKALKDAERRLTVVTGGANEFLSAHVSMRTVPSHKAGETEDVPVHAYLEKPWLHRIYSENCDIAHPKVVCLPTGVDFHTLVGDTFLVDGYARQTQHILRRQLALMHADKGFVLYRSPAETRLESGAIFSVVFQTPTEVRDTLRDAKQVYVFDAFDRHVAKRDVDAEETDEEKHLRGGDRHGQRNAVSLLKAYQPREVVLLVPTLEPRPVRPTTGETAGTSTMIKHLRNKPLYVATTAANVSTMYVPLYTFFQHFAEYTFGHPSREDRLLITFSLDGFRQRFAARKQAMRTKLGFLFEAKSVEAYYDALARFTFVVSPVGVGYDRHRTWNALLMGCIPIVQHPRVFLRGQPENVNTTLQLFDGLPVFVVDDYSDITLAQLTKWKEEVRYKLSRGEYKFEKLFSQYWIDRVFAV